MNMVVCDGCGRDLCKETELTKAVYQNKAEQDLHFPFPFNFLNRIIQYKGHKTAFQLH